MHNKLSWWLERKLGGHIAFSVFGCRVVLFGFNAMHVALNIATKRWGWLCFHPSITWWGHKWPWYFYISPNATPCASTFAIGPGIDHETRRLWPVRWALFGHGFDSRVLYEDGGPYRHLLG